MRSSHTAGPGAAALLPVAAAPLRVALLADYAEEGWPSMDLVATMLGRHLQSDFAGEIRPALLRPPFRRRMSRRGAAVGRGFTADRLINRFWEYPRGLRGVAGEHDVFHLVDHSYAQLVHALPADRTVVTCHDLDTFRCLLDPARERRSAAFRWMTRRVLDGLRAAARVTCDSVATRDGLLAHGLVEESRVKVLPLGVDPLFSPRPDPAEDARVERWLGPPRAGELLLLHVGSTIPRKRIDVLLRIFAGVAASREGARLLRVGGPLTADQAALAASLGVADRIVHLPRLDTPTLAAVYRRAALVLQPTEAEGFGFPVVEALASGTPVLASDLPVLREVGGEAASYEPVAQVERWEERIEALLRERATDPGAWSRRRERGLAQAGRFSWAAFASGMVDVYREVFEGWNS